MNHYSLNEEDSLEMLKSVYRNLRDENDNDNYSNYSFISSWANNYKSWKLSNNLESLFIKYESLENDPLNTFRKIINFTNKILNKNEKIDTKKLENAIETTNFDVLKKKEEKEGFDEAIYSVKDGKRKSFFNLGNKNNYKELLKKETTKSIEENFQTEMKELGYIS